LKQTELAIKEEAVARPLTTMNLHQFNRSALV